jgi:hypothetical protein
LLHGGALALRGKSALPAPTRSQVRNLQDYIRATAREAPGRKTPVFRQAGAPQN